jgi:hypothetical protein
MGVPSEGGLLCKAPKSAQDVFPRVVVVPSAVMVNASPAFRSTPVSTHDGSAGTVTGVSVHGPGGYAVYTVICSGSRMAPKPPFRWRSFSRTFTSVFDTLGFWTNSGRSDSCPTSRSCRPGPASDRRSPWPYGTASRHRSSGRTDRGFRWRLPLGRSRARRRRARRRSMEFLTPRVNVSRLGSDRGRAGPSHPNAPPRTAIRRWSRHDSAGLVRISGSL